MALGDELDRAVLVALVGLGRLAGAEVHGVDPLDAQPRDIRPSLLGLVDDGVIITGQRLSLRR